MTTKEKETFITCPLFQIVTALEPDIRSVLYENVYAKEFVVLSYRTGRKMRIDITGNSDFEITKKVLKAIENV